MWVTSQLQIKNIKTQSHCVVTWLIKCVALCEMRYWAASTASRTANTLFCREETIFMLRLNLNLN